MAIIPDPYSGSSSSVGLGIYNVDEYGGDPTGATDSTAAWSGAIQAAKAAGGGFVWGPGSEYLIAGNISEDITNTPIYLNCAGRWATTVKFTGAGACLRLYDTEVANTSTKWGGCLKGFTIDGTNHTGTGAAGLHIGDLFQFELDVAVQNFTAAGDIGVHLDNQYYYTEDLRGDVFISSCTNAVTYDADSSSPNVTGSFDRDALKIWLNQTGAAGQNGVTFANGTYVTDGSGPSIYGNFSGSANAPTAAGPWVLGLTGVAPAGRGDAGSYSYLGSWGGNIGVECDSEAAHGPYTIYFDATYTGYIDNWSGFADFSPDDTAFTPCNAPGQISSHWGPVNGDTLPNLLPLMASNLGSGPQLINSTSPAAITDLSVNVGATYTPYRLRAYIPYSSGSAAGTPTFAFSDPGLALINVTYRFQTAATPFTTLPVISTSAPAMTGPTLTTGTDLALFIEGTIAFSAVGALGVTAVTSSGTDTFTIGAGAYLELVIAATG